MQSEIFKLLLENYPRMDPHHETWELWMKPNKTNFEFYEVAIGTILVQNTNWTNVNKAINNLKNNSITSFKQMVELNKDDLIDLIKPAGFYRQKAEYLLILSNKMIELLQNRTIPNRSQLLDLKGIGNETADSLLVYCYQQASPIIGTYTRRFFARNEGSVVYYTMRYNDFQYEIETLLGLDFEILGRFHALVVCHCQNLCHKLKPMCKNCFLTNTCQNSIF
ncbi:MAG: hypothetical protein EAX86_03205 [Candidatus Heimdallarchaeota archaeon]|nr:hypothetical protein [Candidatus Heimdallarchaeota archaeon]